MFLSHTFRKAKKTALVTSLTTEITKTNLYVADKTFGLNPGEGF